MIRRGRFAALRALGLATLVAGCGIPAVVPGGGPGPMPEGPFDPNALKPVLTVANGVGPTGPYKAWLYRTKDGSTCLDVASSGGGSGTCAGNIRDLLTASMSGDAQNGIMVVGGVDDPAAAGVVVVPATGGAVPAGLVRPGAIIPASIGLYVVALPPGVAVDRIDVVDGSGNVLSSVDPDP